ncbi:hypothetical protein JOQ06_025257 [Pogonophryne albipinna]|uniref:Uncharacterized protein n=1 Tax=Pogonophryne albipinna TaxID=1090488 RepID=A0AAD6ATB5_9TELE|nr:hypothetical protein JOQ06_025257 [Pogonophryne albipinna]
MIEVGRPRPQFDAGGTSLLMHPAALGKDSWQCHRTVHQCKIQGENDRKSEKQVSTGDWWHPFTRSTNPSISPSPFRFRVTSAGIE